MVRVHGITKSPPTDTFTFTGSPGSSDDKQSACNAGDPGSIPGLENSPGEGIDEPLHFSWTSLVVQMVKNLLAIQETWV